MQLQFEEPALSAMHQWLAEHYPEEACGFLLGHEQGHMRTVTATWPAQNISAENRGRRFIVDPVDYLQAEKRAAREGLVLLGIYHSHPDHPAIPSGHDLAAAHPYFSYAIISVREGHVAETRSYQLHAGKFIEETIEKTIPQIQ